MARPAARPAQGPGVQFRERMRGCVGVAGEPRRVDLRLSVSIPDLTIFLADAVHAARLDGDIAVEGLTGAPVPVRNGTLHLLAPRGTGRRRTVDYFCRSWTTRDASGCSRAPRRCGGNAAVARGAPRRRCPPG